MKIFFIGPLQSSFVKNDIKILEKEHRLTFEDAAIGRGLQGLLNLAKGTLRSVWKTISSDAVFCWFADYTTLVPTLIGRLFGKKVYVIAGGFDVTNLPEINCGAYLRPTRWFCVSNTFRFASKIFPVSGYAMKQLEKLTEGKHAPAKVIYNCTDTQRFAGADFDAERDIVLTVSQGDNQIEYIRKGSDIFIDLARKTANKKFVLAGLRGDALSMAKQYAASVDNLEIIPGPLSLYEQLMPLYRRSYAYCQFSIEETFGVAVLEAMINGSVPIVSTGGALPEISRGSGGFICSSFAEMQEAIAKAENFSADERRTLAEYAKKFDISVREKELLSNL